MCTSRKKVNFYFVNFPKFVRHSSQLIAQNHAREVTRSELNFYSRTTKRVPGEQEKEVKAGKTLTKFFLKINKKEKDKIKRK